MTALRHNYRFADKKVQAIVEPFINEHYPNIDVLEKVDVNTYGILNTCIPITFDHYLVDINNFVYDITLDGIKQNMSNPDLKF